MSGRKGRFLFTLFLVLLVFGFGTKMVHAHPAGSATEEAEDSSVREASGSAGGQTDPEKMEEALLEELDLGEIESDLRRMFPGEKTRFSDVLSALITGDAEETVRIVMTFLKDQFLYESGYTRQNFVYVVLVALIAAVFANFAGVFGSRQVSDISFYVMYMLLMALCLTSFRMAASGAEERFDMLLEFMSVLCPSYFLAVAFASGSTTSLFFYQMVLLLIYVVELLIVRILLPLVHIYVMVRVLGSLTGEDHLSELAELMRKAVTWTLKSLLAGVVGINVVQGLLAPAIDSVKQSALTRAAEALPWVGNAVGGAAEVALGTAVLIKNGIGMAGALIAAVICAVPILQMLFAAVLYRIAAAFVQPVSDKRITACISGVSDGYEMMVRMIVTVALLFLITIAVVAGATS
ncbi:MAG TPA: stage III sporulation protein AE [Candidatus Mediterraneibacter merdipullorum]|nr:stage III sporulation protein AE [Candidatus Mediterraneibacter merdipullorum]